MDTPRVLAQPARPFVGSSSHLVRKASWLALALALAPTLRATDIEWDLASSGTVSWNDSGNWTAASYPGSGDTAVFGANTNGETLDLGGTLTVGSIHITSDAGSGTLTFGSGATNSQTITFSNTGTILQIDSGNSTPVNFNATVNLSDNSLLAIDHDGTTALTFSGDVGGAGRLSLQGTGTTNFLGGITYIGRTEVANGTVNLGNGGASGTMAGDLQIDSTGTFTFNRSDTYTYSSVISGSGTLQQLGSGTTTLTADSSAFAGTTTISAGTLQLGNGGTTGDLGGTVDIDGGTLAINQTGDSIYDLSAITFTSGTLTSSLKVTNVPTIGTGFTVDLTPGGSVTTGVTIAGGELSVGDYDALRLTFNGAGTLRVSGALTTLNNINGTSRNVILESGGSFTATERVDDFFTVNSGATLTLNRTTGSRAFLGTVSGDGALLKQGDGLYSLNNDSSAFTGQTTIEAGTIRLGNGTDNGNLGGSIEVQAPGTLSFNSNSSGITFASTVTGAGNITQDSDATITLTGDGSAFTGTTTINDGTLQLGNNGESGGLGGNIVIETNGTLAFNRSDATSSDRVFSGTGNLAHVGDGTTTLTGDSSAFAGTTTISAGTLQLGNGGTTGDLGGTIDIEGGTLAINRSSGTFDATGVTFSSGTFSSNVELSNLAAITSGVTVDLTPGGSTSGGATINGGELSVGDYDASSLTFTAGTLRAAGALTNYSNLVGSTRTVILDSGGSLQMVGTVDDNITINNGATFTLNRASGTRGVSGVLSGDGSFVKQGAGIFVLTGDSSSFTGQTTIKDGTIQLGNGNFSGNLGGSVEVQTDGTLNFLSNSSGITFASTLTGAGNITQNSDATITLTGDGSAFTGTTTVSAGTLQLGAGSSTGSLGGDIAVGTNGTLAFNRTGTNSSGGVFSGTGNLTHLGSGTTSLTADSSAFAGTTTISAGTLQIGDGGSTGSLGGNIAVDAGGTLAFNRTGTNSSAGVLSGTGSLTHVGSGTTSLTADSSAFAGTTTVSAGTLQLGNGGSTGSLGGNIAVGASGTLAFNRTDTTSSASVFSGTGNLEQLGSGTTTLTGDSSAFAGTTTISAGTLQLGNGGTTGDLGGTIDIDGGTLAINRSSGSFDATGVTLSSGTLSSTIALSNLAAITSGVTVDLTPGGSVTGGATISGGELSVGAFDASNLTFTGAGTLRASGALTNFANINGTSRVVVLESGATLTMDDQVDLLLDVQSGATLTLDRTGDARSLGGSLSGSGALIKTGTGQINVVGDSTFSGQTTVQAGTLQLGNGGTNGNLDGDIEIQTGGTLAINNSGTFSPNSVTINGGTLSAGNLSGLFAPSSLTINSGTLSAGDFSGDFVPGNVTLTGGTLSVSDFDASNLTFNSEGTLRVSGALTNFANINGTSRQVVLESGATLTMNDQVDGIIDVQSGATLTLDRTGDARNLGGSLNGEGALIKTGTGQINVVVTHAFSGQTTIQAGTLQLGIGGTDGNLDGDIEIQSGGTLAINNSGTFSPNSVTINGGTLSAGNLSGLFAPSSLTINSGTLSAGDFSGDFVPGNVTLTGGTLSVSDFDASNLTFNGDGTLRVSGALTNFANINGTSRQVVLESGATLTMNDQVDLLLDLQSGATLTLDRTGDARNLGGSLNGEGALIKTGTGQINVVGTHTFSGQTTIQAGTLQLGDGSTSGKLDGNIEIQADGTLRISPGSTGLSLDAVLTGSGNFQQDSNSYISLMANSSAFTGTTTVNAGTLEIARNLGGAVDVGSNSVVALPSGANLSLSTGTSTLNNGRIEVDSGSTVQTTGSGTLSFHATNGGEIALDGGSLNVSSMSSALDLGAAGLISGNGTVTGDVDLGSAGSITGDITGIDLYGTLSGSGSLANVSIFGTLAPGASPGTINVTGDLTLTLNSTTIMELAGSGGVAGTDYDTINASGILTFNGALEIANYGGYEPAAGQNYTLFSASSFAGDFTSVTVGSIGLTAIEGQDQWSGQDSSLAYFFNADSGVLTLSAVPEPSTYAALAGAIVLGFALRRRRAKASPEHVRLTSAIHRARSGPCPPSRLCRRCPERNAAFALSPTSCKAKAGRPSS